MSQRVTIAKVGDIAEGESAVVTLGNKDVAVFHAGGKFYAIDDTCPHRGAPLSEGMVAGKEVTCPWHAARFDLSTGAPLCPPARADVHAYKVQVVGEEVQVEVPG